MRRINNCLLTVVCIVALISCKGGESSIELKSAKSGSARVGIESTIPTAKGEAYVIVRQYKNEDDYDGELHIWFVSGSSRTEVPVKVEDARIIPLADGAAMLQDGMQWWRLEGNEATPIVAGNALSGQRLTDKEGFYFALWYLADQDKEGLTDRDRDEHMEELASEYDEDPGWEY